MVSAGVNERASYGCEAINPSRELANVACLELNVNLISGCWGIARTMISLLGGLGLDFALKRAIPAKRTLRAVLEFNKSKMALFKT